MTIYTVLASRPGHENDNDGPVLHPGDTLIIERGSTPEGFCDPCWDWFFIYRQRPAKCVHFSETGALRADEGGRKKPERVWQPLIQPSKEQMTLA